MPAGFLSTTQRERHGRYLVVRSVYQHRNRANPEQRNAADRAQGRLSGAGRIARRFLYWRP